MPDLFTPIQIGSIHAKNRILMAPLTRSRAGKDAIPNELMAKYYGQRASAGLIISEAVGVSRGGLGWPNTPGIWSDAQVENWKKVTETVHNKGGKIICQLWHMGRAAHSKVSGIHPVSASATRRPGKILTYEGLKEAEIAKEMTLEEIKAAVNDHAAAAKNAIRAGFDGVQIHGANGYLIDQFLRDSANKRTDEFGTDRLKFLEQVVTAVIDAVGAERTSVRFSPNGPSLGVIDSDPEPLFVAAAKMLQEKQVSMLELRQESEKIQPKVNEAIRKVFKGVLVLNQGYDKESATKEIESGAADAISFGRGFIANPDFVRKIKEDIPLRSYDAPGVYSGGAHGYTDFPEGP